MAAARRATTDSPLPDFSTVLNRDRTQCRFDIRDSQPHAVLPSGHSAARCSTGAWLYRLAIRENSTASVTHCFGTHDWESCGDRDAQRPGRRCGHNQPASRATVPGAPASGPRARAHPHAKRFDAVA